jgi:hypothetical protein
VNASIRRRVKTQPSQSEKSRYAKTPATGTRLSDALVRRGLAYAGRRTPGIWKYNALGKILAKPGTIKNADSTYEVASVTERYTDAMTVCDSAFIVEAVNHYELALLEIQSIREREQYTTSTTADDVRAQLRAFISASLEARTLIDPHDLFALAEMPLVETPDPTKTICPDCHRFYHQALETRAIEISGPVLICECVIDR